MHTNILNTFLKELNVRHTHSFTELLYEEHPHKYNLYGISRMLHEYKIKNGGLRVEKESIRDIEVPFIAHTGNDFIVVKKVHENHIDYQWRDKSITLPLNEFQDAWTGIVLLAEPDENSIEPDYEKHKTEEMLRLSGKVILGCLLLVGLITACYRQETFKSAGLSLSLIFSTVGVYISYLLLLKQSHTQSKYADKICSLFHQKDCNNVLESDAAKIARIFSWSEIGLGYFISNIMLCIFFPTLINYMALINLCTLPYTLWSVWYQHKVAMQWCVLCLTVQLLLWFIFIGNLITGQILQPVISIYYLLLIGVIYLVPTLSINLLMGIINKANRVQNITQELNSIKNTDEVFLTLLKLQPHYKVNSSNSQIIFGNPKAAQTITILSNPHCEPCAKMHKRVENLLEKAGDKLCIQYIFSAFNNDFLRSNRFLIAAYLHQNKDDARKIYEKWYEKERYTPDTFFRQFGFPLDEKEIEQEIERQKKWKTENHLSATPTLLVNGYLLPEVYKIEDMIYFTELEIN